MKEFILKFLKSRTVWTVIIMFLVNGISGIRELLPGVYLPLVDTLLGLATIYFHVKPKQKF